MKNDDFDLSVKLIAAKRLRLNDALAKIRGVHFFISSVNVITSSAREKMKMKTFPNKRASPLIMIAAKYCLIMVSYNSKSDGGRERVSHLLQNQA